MHTEERTLDVAKKDGRSGQIKPIILRKGEQNQTQIKINLTSYGEPYSIGNLTPKFCAVLPDKKYVRDTSHVTKSTNYVTYTVQSDLTSASGDIRVAYIELQSSGNSLTSDTLPIIVLDNTDITTEQAQQYQDQIEALVKDLENSINKANNAASSASTAADAANTAASNANTARTNATNAANSANSAATAANNAASAANTAKTNADAATKSANDAATKANTAASNADTATGKANTAASSANSAATSANNAAKAANDAAASVDEAKTNANNAASAANTAAQSANSAASAANTAKTNADKATSAANTAAEAANTAKQAVDEAMEQFTTVTDSTVEYQVGTSGTTPPTGTWVSNPPDVPQGQYLWVRNTTSYNKGNPTVAYAVAFQGRDGSFAGDDRVETLEEKVDSINDYTTGENLISGSRDFRKGTNLLTTNFYSDGFYLGSIPSTSIDNDGFTVVTITNSGSQAIDIFAPNLKVTNGEIYTISFDFMASTATNVNFCSAQFLDDSYTSVGATNFNSTTILGAGYDTNVWHRAVCHLTVNNANAKNLRIILRANNVAGTFKFKKLAVNQGNINNPIYSVSPAELSLEPVNDITTLPNLLRGTRDISKGTIKSTKNPNNVFVDGFGGAFYSLGKVEESVDGFGCAYIDDTTQRTMYASSIESFIPGEEMTFSFELMLQNKSSISVNKDIAVIQLFPAGSLSKTLQTVRLSQEDLNTFENGIWYRKTVYFTVPVDANPETDFILVSFYLLPNKSLMVRLPLVYHDHIEKPEWYASPFDYASSMGTPYYLSKSSVPKAITDGQDLFTIMEPDIYYCPSGTTAQTLKNCPTAAAFKMIVETINGEPWLLRHTIVDAANNTFTGQYQVNVNNSQWRPWVNLHTNVGVLPIEGGGTGAESVKFARRNLKIDTQIDNNYTFDNVGSDKVEFWKEKDGGWYWGANAYGQPASDWAYIHHIHQENTTYRTLMTQVLETTKGVLGYRGISNTVDTAPEMMPRFKIILNQEDPRPYNSGIYQGVSMAEKFKNEIGSTHIATWLQSRVKAGNFEGLNIGDYVDITLSTGDTVRYLIAGIDTYYRCSSPRFSHNLIMVPDTSWRMSTSKDGEYANSTNNIFWNTTADNNGNATDPCPYMVSNLHKWEIEVHLPRFPKEWQNVMLERHTLLETRYSANSKLTEPIGTAFKNIGKLWSLSEIEVYGFPVNNTSRFNAGYDCHLPLFAQSKDRIKSETQKWLRTVHVGSSDRVAMFSNEGIANSASATYEYVAPYSVFMIG